MFTGIIENTGKVVEIKQNGENLIFKFEAKIEKKLGSSILVNGTCLTVISFDDNFFSVEAIPETLRLTNLGTLKLGDVVNLEESMKIGQTLDGHFVSGHVDFTSTVISIDPDGDHSVKITFSIPEEKIKFFAYKGSVAINGVSLTISDTTNNSISVSLIPYTLERTNLSKLQVGSTVNIEIDLLMRYLEKLSNFTQK